MQIKTGSIESFEGQFLDDAWSVGGGEDSCAWVVFSQRGALFRVTIDEGVLFLDHVEREAAFDDEASFPIESDFPRMGRVVGATFRKGVFVLLFESGAELRVEEEPSTALLRVAMVTDQTNGRRGPDPE